jgi:hypothetical protein
MTLPDIATLSLSESVVEHGTDVKTKKPPKAGFLSLSPELRNRVYHLAFQSGGAVHIIRSRRHVVCEKSAAALVTMYKGQENIPWADMTSLQGHCTPGHAVTLRPLYIPGRLPLQLLQVCKQIYRDARLIPLAMNEFTVWGITLHAFLARLTREQRGALRRLTLHCTFDGLFTGSLSEDLTGLEHLCISIQVGGFKWRPETNGGDFTGRDCVGRARKSVVVLIYRGSTCTPQMMEVATELEHDLLWRPGRRRLA